MRLPLFTVLLAVLNVLLVWAIGVLLLGEPRFDEQVKVAAAAAKVPVAPEPPAMLAPPSFDGLQAQAAFHKTRSFYVPPPPTVQQPTPDYRLVGLMALPNRPPSAVLVSNITLRMAATTNPEISAQTVLPPYEKILVISKSIPSYPR